MALSFRNSHERTEPTNYTQLRLNGMPTATLEGMNRITAKAREAFSKHLVALGLYGTSLGDEVNQLVYTDWQAGFIDGFNWRNNKLGNNSAYSAGYEVGRVERSKASY